MKETIFFANFGNTWSDNEGSLTEEKVELEFYELHYAKTVLKVCTAFLQ